VLIAIAVAASVVVAFAVPPMPQPLAYHDMADQRFWLGISNALNVLSNLPFAIVGALGLAATFAPGGNGRQPWRDAWERWPYAALFIGVALTAVGSSYYHLAPDNGRLVWDRLPMTIGFMGLLTAIVAERVSIGAAKRLLVPLLILGAASVAYWHWTELQGRGDLRLYGLVQFGSLLVVVLLLVVYPARDAGSGYLYAGLALYALAKVFELADAQILALGGIVSGHTLKHLAAAAGVACVVAMLRARARQGSDAALMEAMPPRPAIERTLSK
jgi:hypothetical protein